MIAIRLLYGWLSWWLGRDRCPLRSPRLHRRLLKRTRCIWRLSVLARRDRHPRGTLHFRLFGQVHLLIGPGVWAAYTSVLYWATRYLTHHYLIDDAVGACFAIVVFNLLLPRDLTSAALLQPLTLSCQVKTRSVRCQSTSASSSSVPVHPLPVKFPVGPLGSRPIG